MQYRIVYTSKNGNWVKEPIFYSEEERRMNQRIAKILCDNNLNVKLLENKNINGVSSPDAEIESIGIFEFKTISTQNHNTVDAAIRKARKQAQYIVLLFEKEVDVCRIWGVIKGRLEKTIWVKEVWLIHQNKLVKKTRKEIVSL